MTLATVGQDYPAASGTLTFTAAAPNPTMTIGILNDEVGETFSIVFASADETATPSSSTVTIIDDEVSPTVSLSPAAANEGDGGVSFTATLSKASGRTTRVEYSTSGELDDYETNCSMLAESTGKGI